MSNSLHVIESFIKTVLLECKVSSISQLYDDCSIRVYRFVHYNFPQMLNIAINIYFTLPYYVGIMLNAFNYPLCSKLCWHNGRVLIAT